MLEIKYMRIQLLPDGKNANTFYHVSTLYVVIFRLKMLKAMKHLYKGLLIQ